MSASSRATAEFNKTKAKLEKEIRECQRLRANAANGVVLTKLQLAESVLEVYGKVEGSKRLEVIEDAIRDLASGAQRLRRGYFGVKNYAARSISKTLSWLERRAEHPAVMKAAARRIVHWIEERY